MRAWFMAVVLLGCQASETGVSGKTGPEVVPYPGMRVEPATLDFGALPLDTTVVEAFTVRSAGADVLTVESIELVGDVSFTLLDLPVLPLTLDPGGVITVDVAYNTRAVGESATVWVRGDAPDTPEAAVELRGTWAQPALCVDPEEVLFGDIPPLCVEEQTVVLESCGDGDLTLDLIAVTSDTGLGLVEAAPELPIVLAPGETLALQVQFAPEEEGVADGTLVVGSDDPGGRRDVPLSGRSAEGLLCDGVGLYELEMEAEYQIADIAFLLDLGKWHSALAPALAGDLAEVAAEIQVEIPDVTFGVATFKDYETYGGGMWPYRLEQQQTDEIDLVVASLRSLSYTGWSGGWATGFEAVVQAAGGQGYDEGCDRSFNSGRDAKPFIASPLDAFNGLVAGSEDFSTPGTGRQGGMGFRDKVLPVFVLVTHSKIRDPGAGNPSPGGCSGDADLYAAYEAVSELGGKVVGVWGDAGITFPETRVQLEQLAVITGSYFDIDGDYILEPAVVNWDGSDYQFKKVLVAGVTALAGSATFDKVHLELDDPAGVVLSVAPEFYSPAAAGEPVPFTLQLEGEVVPTPGTSTVEVVAELIADDSIVLSRRTLYVVPN
ncbi:MAG: hypothetical protein ACI8PZ_000534 [Myxococcota bacterium]|jgi:hypothetical protein